MPRLTVFFLALTALSFPPAYGEEATPLRFLPDPPDRPIHHHINRIRVTRETLESGWASLFQCHENMDALGASQIVFNEERTRDLEVERSRNIERVRIEGTTVLLDGVAEGAEICISGESRALRRTDSGVLVVRNGPFMRRFLDSYFSMHVTLVVRFPSDRLAFLGLRPEPRPGLTIRRTEGRITVEAWFKGVLRTRLRFRQ